MIPVGTPLNNLDFLTTMVGTGVFVMLAITLIWISTSFDSFDRYGREALRCAAAFILVVATTRTLNAMGILIPTDARAVNTIAGFVTFSILVQVILTRYERQAMDRSTRR